MCLHQCASCPLCVCDVRDIPCSVWSLPIQKDHKELYKQLGAASRNASGSRLEAQLPQFPYNSVLGGNERVPGLNETQWQFLPARMELPEWKRSQDSWVNSPALTNCSLWHDSREKQQ